MAREKKLVILSVRVDDALAAAVKQLAEADSRPVSNYIEVLLRKHVAEKVATVAVKPSKAAKREPKA